MLGMAPPLKADREFCLLPGQNSGASPPGHGVFGASPSPSPLGDLRQSLAPWGGQWQLEVTPPSGILSRTFPELNAGRGPSAKGTQRVLCAAQAELWSFPSGAQSRPLELPPAPVLSKISGNP